MFRHLLVTATAVAVTFVPAHAVMAAPCWRPPVTGHVTDPFDEPSCPYCAGNRGLEYSVGTNVQVRAVATGLVAWSGVVAGTRYVVVRHANGWRTTYGKLTSTSLRTGDRVVQRSHVGTASDSFYFGLRVGSQYRDPAPYLGRLVGPPRLVPVDGSVARRSSPQWRCVASA